MIDDKYVKKVLCERNKRRMEIHKRIMELYGEMQDSDDMIRSMAASKISYDWERRKGAVKKDLGDWLFLHKQLIKNQNREIEVELWNLTQEEERMNRIWVCFRTLEVKEQEFLQKLYVEGHAYKDVERESGLSHKSFETIRAKGVKRIIQLYESEMSNQEIIEQSGQAHFNSQAPHS